MSKEPSSDYMAHKVIIWTFPPHFSTLVGWGLIATASDTHTVITSIYIYIYTYVDLIFTIIALIQWTF